MQFSLVLYVIVKGSQCGASSKNSNFNPFLTMSRMNLSEVTFFQFSKKKLCWAKKKITLVSGNAGDEKKSSPSRPRKISFLMNLI